MIEYYKKDLKRKGVIKLDNFIKNCWVNVISPDEKEIDFLTEKFKLDKDLLIDGLDIFEMSRLEEVGSNAYVYLRIPTFNIENEYTASFLVIVLKESMITVSDERLDLFNRLFKTKKNFFDNLPAKDLMNLLFILSNKFSYWIRSISKDVKKNRRNLRSLNEKDILDLAVQEDILNEYLSSLEQLIGLHSCILRSKYMKLHITEKEFIEDLIVDLNQTTNLCMSSLKTITNMRDYYSSALSNNRNEILRVLTIFTIFLTIPMVLSGLYGMNVKLPMEEYKEAFWVLLVMIGLIWAIAIVALKKLKIV